jgi:ribokinase
LASSVGTPIILNPAPASELPRDLLAKVAFLTPNEHEAEILSGIAVTDDASAIAAAKVLLDMGVEVAILTLGPRGALIASRDTQQFVSGFPLTAIDTVGAGDVFNGALAVALGAEMPVVEAVRFANAAAAVSVTRSGAQASAPSRKDIVAQLECHLT